MKRIDLTLALTQRCNAKCSMCDMHLHPTDPSDEMPPALAGALPPMNLVNVTGGEPFLRKDLEEWMDVLGKRARRILISTNGYDTERIAGLARRYPGVGIRVSIDGDRETHNRIRGIDIYDRAVRTLERLAKMRHRDIGIAFTLQNDNYREMLPLYRLAREKGLDFGVSVIHNSFYFGKDDNRIGQAEAMAEELQRLIRLELSSARPKDWARAYFNAGSAGYILGKPAPLPCDAGRSSFYIDAKGSVFPCNMTPAGLRVGNLEEQGWDEMMKSKKAVRAAEYCKNCKIQCWSVCGLRETLRRNSLKIGLWCLAARAGKR